MSGIERVTCIKILSCLCNDTLWMGGGGGAELGYVHNPWNTKHSQFSAATDTTIFWFTICIPASIIAPPREVLGCCCWFYGLLQLLCCFRRHHHGSAVLATPSWGRWDYVSSPRATKKDEQPHWFIGLFSSGDIASWHGMD